MLAVDMGAGRKKQDDVIDYAAGIVFEKNAGDEIRAGEPIARLQLGDRPAVDADLVKRYLAAVEFGDTPPAHRPIVHELLSS